MATQFKAEIWYEMFVTAGEDEQSCDDEKCINEHPSSWGAERNSII